MNLNSEIFIFCSTFLKAQTDDQENTFALLYSNILFNSILIQVFDGFLENIEDLAGLGPRIGD